MSFITTFCRASFFSVLICATAGAWAQPAPLLQNDPGSSKTPEGRTQRIHIEDRDVQINEVRVRGETQSIEVKTQGPLPAYEVIPNTASQPPGTNRSEGQRVWRVLSF